jgi:hypothetical protein
MQTIPARFMLRAFAPRVAGTPVADAIDMKKRHRMKQALAAEAGPQMSGDTTVATPDRERVARRAYELYTARGCADGQAEDDWLCAERELTNSDRSRDE